MPQGGIVLCDDCKTEPLTPGHYCECCGRLLSLHERKPLAQYAEPAPAPQVPAPSVDSPGLFAAPPASIGLQTISDPTPPEKPSIPSLDPRCESCGGPAEKDGDLCASCEKAFHSLLDSTTLAPPADNRNSRSRQSNRIPSR